MAHDSLGTQNQPQYAGTGAPADAADLSEISNYAALVGNRKTGATSLRNAASGANVWEGLIWGDTTDGFDYRYTSGAWAVMLPKGAKIPLGRVRIANASATVLGTSMADVTGVTVTATSHGGLVVARCTGLLDNLNSAAVRPTPLQLMCDGVLIGEASQPILAALLSGFNGYTSFTVEAESTPTAGSHTWKLQGSTNAVGAVSVNQPILTIEELI